jgi:hypothetical protein
MLSIVLQLCSFFHGELEMPYELAMTPSGKSLKTRVLADQQVDLHSNIRFNSLR